MGVVGLGLSEMTPTNHTPSPIAAARGVVRNEGLIANGRRALPVAVGITIVGYAGVGTAPRSGQDKQPVVIFDECLEVGVFHAQLKWELSPFFLVANWDFRMPSISMAKPVLGVG
jgi:hypothetical protein